jgi:hypothetical protein
MNLKSDKQFELSSVSQSTYLFLIGIALLPGLLIAFLWALNPAEYAQMPIWLLLVLLFIGPLVILISMQGIMSPTVVLNSEFISIKVSFIKKKWAINTLLRDQVRLINLDKETAFKPKWKLFGAAMPGLRSGYFRLSNKQNAHIYLTDFQKVVYIPTQKGPLLLSLKRPKEFMDYLQSL